MAGNSTIIDEVVDPVAIKQFNDLTIASKAATDSMITALEVAIKLNATTGGSTAATFAKNAKASSEATQKLINDQQKVIDLEAKKQAVQEATVNKYLVLLSKQQAERDKADAKEIQQAQQKAAKLQAIEDKASAEQARKAAVQFPQGQQSNNPVTSEPDVPSVRYEPIITGEENMQIAMAKSSEQANIETASLDDLSAARIKTIQLLIELQAEQAQNTASLKALNVQTAAQAEEQVLLIDEQFRLKTAIQQTNLTLSQQTKQMVAEDTSAAQMQARLDELRVAYNNLNAAEKENIEIGGVLAEEITRLDIAVKENAASVGIFNKEVGNYPKLAALGERATQQFVRQIIRMGVEFLLIGVIFEGAKWLYDYIAALNIFNPIATEAEQRQKALTDAFSNSTYTDAISKLEKLQADLDLAKKGFADSDSVINEYNDTIGKTTGFVDNLNDAQQGFIDKSADFIRAATLEAAAQILLADSAKFAADTAVKNQKIQNDIEELNQAKIDAVKAGKTNPNGIDVRGTVISADKDIAADKKAIADNLQREKDYYNTSIKGLESFYKERNDLQKKNGVTPGSNGQPDAIAVLRNDLANQQLEREKLIAQNLIGDEKQSYSTRLVAVQDFYKASKGIADNNEKLATNGVKLSTDQKQKIEGDYSNAILQLQQTRDTQLATLRDKAYKQDQEILKNNIQKQKDLFKGILDDPNQSYDAKLGALGAYNNRSLDLIKANYSEQVKEAGENAKSITLAKQAEAKSELELTNEVAEERIKIQKEASDKLKKDLEDLIRYNEDAAKNAIANLRSISDQQIQSIDNQESKQITALDKRYASGLLGEKKYQTQLKAIRDQANIDRLGAEAFVQQQILEVKQAKENADIANLQGQGGQSAIDKIRANSGVAQQQIVVDKAGNALTGALNTQDTDQAKEAADKKKAAEEAALEFAKQTQQSVDELINKSYEKQIANLEKVGKQIDENAQIEKDAVERSLDTQQDKARRTAIIDAQTASQQRALQNQINQEKTKQAKAEKVEAIANIVENTAVAITKVLGQTGIFGIPLVPVVAALGAVQLAAAIATPLPTFAKGGVTSGGLVVYGERGAELVEEPGKSPYLSPGVATIANLPKGTKITPHNMLPQLPQWTETRTDNSDVVNAMSRVEKAIKNQRTSTPRISGWLSEQRKADAWNNYSAKHFQ